MTEANVLLKYDAKQTDKGLQLTDEQGAEFILRDHTLGPVTEWPQHLQVPKLFYLWALSNDSTKGDWAVAEVGLLHFYLADGWAAYRLAHTVQDGAHWDLQDSGRGV